MRNTYGQWKITGYDLRAEQARQIGSIFLIGYRAEIENVLLAMRADLPSGYGATLTLEGSAPPPTPRVDPLA